MLLLSCIVRAAASICFSGDRGVDESRGGTLLIACHRICCIHLPVQCAIDLLVLPSQPDRSAPQRLILTPARSDSAAFSEARMSAIDDRIRVRLPPDWPRRVRSGAIYAISLARLSLTAARGHAANSWNARSSHSCGRSSASRAREWSGFPHNVGRTTLPSRGSPSLNSVRREAGHSPKPLGVSSSPR